MSDPPAGVTFQAFSIFPKIAEIDSILRGSEALRLRVFESHPEVAFCVLNVGQEMQHAKRTRLGEDERKAVLVAHGYERRFLDQPPPSGAKVDDFLDAACMMLVAGRIRRGEADSFPDPPYRDAYGIPVAIRA